MGRDEIATALGSALQAGLRRRGELHRDLAAALGVSPANVSSWVRGVTQIPLAQAQRVDALWGRPRGALLLDAGLLDDPIRLAELDLLLDDTGVRAVHEVVERQVVATARRRHRRETTPSGQVAHEEAIADLAEIARRLAVLGIGDDLIRSLLDAAVGAVAASITSASGKGVATVGVREVEHVAERGDGR